MANRSEVATVYAAGVVQGIALVTFPAASAIFTSPTGYGLSSQAYGSIFLPQAICAVGASLLGASITRHIGIKRVYQLGLVADLLSMAILLLSQSLVGEAGAASLALSVATACLGFGFGLTVSSLNTFAAAFFPLAIDRSVLIMNALLGVGTVLAPVLVAIFVGLGNWSLLPLLVATLIVFLLGLSFVLTLRIEREGSPQPRANVRSPIPAQFWMFALMSVLYGVVETLNGNWATLYVVNVLGVTGPTGPLALATFWATVTIGRVLFALIAHHLPEHQTYRGLPIVAAAAFGVTAFLPRGSGSAAVAAFALGGLGCSALLPLTISFGQKELVALADSIAGGLLAFYQIGYGLAAFGVAPLESTTGIGLRNVYGMGIVVALSMAAVAFLISSRIALTPRTVTPGAD